MKTAFHLVLIGLLMSDPVLLLAQTDLSQKHEFVYKTVNEHDIKATVFLPSPEGLHPVLIYYHGGGFIFGNKDQGLQPILKDALLANNYAVVSADYRLAPETKLDEILKDASDVVKWIRVNGPQEFNIDTGRIAVAGGSAGGYLALSTGFDKDLAPDAIVAISTPTGFSTGTVQMGDLSVLNHSGPYDIVKDSTVSHGDYESRMALWRFLAGNGLALYEIFGFDPSKEPARLKKYTLTSNITPDYPPTLIVHAKKDHLVDFGQVDAFYTFLQNNKVESKLYLVENGHSSELINGNPDAVDEIIGFLNALFNK